MAPPGKGRGEGADGKRKKQDNITILLDLLEDGDFYIRLYALQLLAAISNNRPARTQECVYTAPLGVNRLVDILEDKREAIRNGMFVWLVGEGRADGGQRRCC